MTTYSAIANSEIAVGAPITNSLMTKVRDNPLAIQENDGTAPTVALASAITNQGALATLDSVAAAQIDANAVGASEIAANAVGTSEITQSVGSSGTQTIALNGTWTPSAGLYNIVNSSGVGTLFLELSVSSVWRRGKTEFSGGFLWCDGTNMRFIETGGASSSTINYQKLA